MHVEIICFTNKGMELGHKIQKNAENGDYHFALHAKYESFVATGHASVTYVTESLSQWTLEKQQRRCALIFVGAMGIAVRAIAAGLTGKLTDAPVVVVDELGMHVIPVVAGHMGGGNALALHIADAIGAIPVITTATDLEGSFAVDLFAKENHLVVYNKEGIAKVSAKALEGKAIRLSIENYPPKAADVIISSDKSLKACGELLLCPKAYGVGIGCRKGTDFARLNTFFLQILQQNEICVEQVGAIGTIDLKANEQGLLELSRFYSIPLITFTKELLEQASGSYEESDFVKAQTGVGNVCERAAMLLTGNRGEVIQKKCCNDGMTMAIVKSS